MRGWRAHLSGMVVCAALVAGALVLGYGSGSPPALPTSASGPGTCHASADWTELWWTASDTAPAVPCNTPHQTETMWVQLITGPLAGVPRRPNPELLTSELSGRCDDFARVQTYLGADESDAHWGVGVLARFPTLAEWSRGERVLRCEGVTASAGLDAPVSSESLQGALRRADSSRFRMCRAAIVVTCDQPHRSEAMNPLATLANPPGANPLSAGPDGAGPGVAWPGDAAVQRMAVAACGPVAERYLGAALKSRPDLAVTADVPTRDQWALGQRGAQCWLTSAAGRSMTGTLRGGVQ